MAFRPLKQNASLKALNQPRPVEVTTLNGVPAFVNRRGKDLAVIDIRDVWRIDDRWWTESPVSRMYYELELPEAQVLTVYHDLVEDLWYEQRQA